MSRINPFSAFLLALNREMARHPFPASFSGTGFCQCLGLWPWWHCDLATLQQHCSFLLGWGLRSAVAAPSALATALAALRAAAFPTGDCLLPATADSALCPVTTPGCSFPPCGCRTTMGLSAVVLVRNILRMLASGLPKHQYIHQHMRCADCLSPKDLAPFSKSCSGR